MNRRQFGSLALLGGAAFAFSACARAPQQPTIREIFASNQAFSILAAALDTAGLLGATGGPFTVFAPNNAAFSALPKGKLDKLLLPENRAELTAVLSHHIVPGLYPATALINKTTQLTAIDGTRFNVDGFNGIRIGGVSVIQPDVMASDGIIQVINGLILP